MPRSARTRFRYKSVFSDSCAAVFFDTPVVARQSKSMPIGNGRERRPPVANISLTLCLFSPNSAKVVQFPSALVARFARHARQRTFSLSRTRRKKYRECLRVSSIFTKALLSRCIFNGDSKPTTSPLERGALNLESEDFFAIKASRKIPRSSELLLPLFRFSRQCGGYPFGYLADGARVRPFVRPVFFEHDTSRYFPSVPPA